MVIVEPHFQRRLARRGNRYPGIGRRPVRHTFVNEGIHQNPADTVPVTAVDPQGLPFGDITGPIIAHQSDIGWFIETAETVAERLYCPGLSVL